MHVYSYKFIFLLMIYLQFITFRFRYFKVFLYLDPFNICFVVTSVYRGWKVCDNFWYVIYLTILFVELLI